MITTLVSFKSCQVETNVNPALEELDLELVRPLATLENKPEMIALTCPQIKKLLLSRRRLDQGLISIAAEHERAINKIPIGFFKLEILSITHLDISADQMSATLSSCPKLSHMRLHDCFAIEGDMDERRDNLSRLLCLVGDKLTQTALTSIATGLSVAAVEQLEAHCPRVTHLELDIDGICPDSLLQLIQNLAKHLIQLDLSVPVTCTEAVWPELHSALLVGAMSSNE